ncbi:MAG: 4-(cytidine 5'-diphospho)-2-C-methyl-D-erythritol kinase [candidate division Zixibacteria bacterium]|nr:4-(cytidine 5'-diphospho)-2-C-methyl-D-erythritol kinase [candidate division Zixibacteria bacterium]
MFIKRLSPDSLIIGAPAKVNLFLQVLDKRTDGYHNIYSLFQAVALFDRLTITRRSEPGIQIELVQKTAGPALSVGPDNLIARAYRGVAEKTGLTEGVFVRLEKNIPIAAGLGGGSADAAAAIVALDALYDLNMSQEVMAEIGLGVGSDVPFFFGGGQSLVSGRGEILQPSNFPLDYWVVLVTPPIAVSTGQAYQSLGRTGLTNPKRPFMLDRCGSTDEFFSELKLIGNDFEENHLRSFPELARIKDELLRSGAVLARMSGSGPTMFGLYRFAPPAELDSFVAGDGWSVHTVRPVVLPVCGSQHWGGDRGDYRDSGHPQE